MTASGQSDRLTEGLSGVEKSRLTWREGVVGNIVRPKTFEGQLLNVQRSVVSEDNGWLKLASYGFTFSKKEIKVSLSQPFTLNLSRFTKANAILSAKQKSEISLAVTRAENNKSLTCSVMYFATSSKALAQSRAKAICKHAKSLNSIFAIKSEAIKTTNKSLDGRLVLTSK